MPHSTANGTDHPATAARRYMLITNPRTCSNLLVRILALNQQPKTKHGSYHFLDTVIKMLNENYFATNPDDWSDEQKKELFEATKTGIQKMQDNLIPAADEDVDIVFTKEHVETITEPVSIVKFAQGLQHTKEQPWKFQLDSTGSTTGETIPPYSPGNFTIFPDEYLESWQPIFLMRHPARAFESIYRSFVDVFNKTAYPTTTAESMQATLNAHMTLSWTRTLYEWYTSRGIPAIILDADDLILHPKPLTQKLAAHIGFDADLFQYAWKEATADERAAKEAAVKRMVDTLDASSGVVADPDKVASSIGSLDAQLPKWTEKYGEEVANMLLERVQAAMEDYAWLKERRMRPLDD